MHYIQKYRHWDFFYMTKESSITALEIGLLVNVPLIYPGGTGGNLLFNLLLLLLILSAFAFLSWFPINLGDGGCEHSCYGTRVLVFDLSHWLARWNIAFRLAGCVSVPVVVDSWSLSWILHILLSNPLKNSMAISLSTISGFPWST